MAWGYEYQDTPKVSRCQIGQALVDVSCNLPAETYAGGRFVCSHHARKLETIDRGVLLRGIVSTLDLCLMSFPLRRDAELVEDLRLQRSEAALDLAQTVQDLRQAESECPHRSRTGPGD